MKPSCSVRSRNRRVALAFVACVICAATLFTRFARPVRASGGRDFTGIYSVSNVTDLGDQVRMTFAARVFNFSDSDVIGATVALRGPGAPAGAYATFNSVTVRDKESVRLSQDITVPQQQYALWHKGQPPLLVVHYLNLSGVSQHSAVELSRGLVGQE